MATQLEEYRTALAPVAKAAATDSQERWIAASQRIDKLPERLDDKTMAALRKFALEPLPPLEPAGPAYLEKCLRMLATLPRKNADDVSGEAMVEMYRLQLHGYAKPQLDHLVKEAGRTCEWMPSPARCIEIIGSWPRDDLPARVQRKALHRVFTERQARERDKMLPPPGGWVTPEEIEEIKIAAIRSVADA